MASTHTKFDQFIRSVHTVAELHSKPPTDKQYLLKSQKFLKSPELVEDRSLWSALLDQIPLIEPFSIHHQLWDYLIILVVVYLFITVPLCIAFNIENFSIEVDYFVDCIFVLDILVSFNTVYIDDQSLQHVTDRREISLHYLKNWFTFDLLAAIPLNSTYSSVVHRSKVVNLVRCLKLLRLYNLYKLAKLKQKEDIDQIHNNGLHYRKQQLFLVLLLLLHFYACIWIFTAHAITDIDPSARTWLTNYGMEGKNMFSTYFTALYWVFVTVVSVGYGDIHATNPREMIVAILVMLSGSLIMGIIVSQVSHFISTLNARSVFVKQEINELKSYMVYEKFPTALRQRIYLAYKYYFHIKSGFEIEYHFQGMPTEIYKKYLISVYDNDILLLRNLFPMEMALDLFEYLTPFHAVRDEILLQIGDICQDINFIVKGEVRIRNNEGKIVGYVKPGGFFGDMEFYKHGHCCVTYEAVESCTLLTIAIDEIDNYLLSHLEHLPAVQEIMEKRYNHMVTVLLSCRKREKTDEEIVMEMYRNTRKASIFNRTLQYGRSFIRKNSNASLAPSDIEMTPQKSSSRGNILTPESLKDLQPEDFIDLNADDSDEEYSLPASPKGKPSIVSQIFNISSSDMETTMYSNSSPNRVNGIRSQQQQPKEPRKLWINGEIEIYDPTEDLTSKGNRHSNEYKYRVYLDTSSSYSDRNSHQQQLHQRLYEMIWEVIMGAFHWKASPTEENENRHSSITIKEYTAMEIYQTFHIFHPTLRFKVFWDLLVLFFICYSALAVPIQIAYFHLTSYGYSFAMDIIIDFIFFVDILITLRSSYYSSGHDAWIIDKSKIAHHYILTVWFIIDVLSCIPWDLAFLAISTSDGYEQSFDIARLLKLLRLFRLAKLIRMIKFDEVFDRIDQYLGIKPIVFDMLRLVVNVLFVAHLIACVWWGVTAALPGEKWFDNSSILDTTTTTNGDSNGTSAVVFSEQIYISLRNMPLFDKYITSLYWAVVTLTTTGYGDIIPLTVAERIVNIFVIIFSATVFGYIVSQIASIMNDLMSDIKSERLIFLKNYLEEKHCSRDLIAVISNYYHDVYDRNFSGNEGKILSRLPRKLRDEILLYKKSTVLGTIPIFHYLRNRSMQVRLLESLTAVTVKRGELLGTGEELLTKIYFVTDGELEVLYSEENDSIDFPQQIKRRSLAFTRFGKGGGGESVMLSRGNSFFGLSQLREGPSSTSIAAGLSKSTKSVSLPRVSFNLFNAPPPTASTAFSSLPVDELGMTDSPNLNSSAHGGGGGGNKALHSLSPLELHFQINELKRLYDEKVYHKSSKQPSSRGGSGKGLHDSTAAVGPPQQESTSTASGGLRESERHPHHSHLHSNDLFQDSFVGHPVNALATRVLGKYYTGDVIGLASLVKNKKSRTRIRAKTTAKVLVLSTHAIEFLLKHLPVMGFYLQSALGKVLKDQERIHSLRYHRDYHVRLLEEFRVLCLLHHEQISLEERLQVMPGNSSLLPAAPDNSSSTAGSSGSLGQLSKSMKSTAAEIINLTERSKTFLGGGSSAATVLSVSGETAPDHIHLIDRTKSLFSIPRGPSVSSFTVPTTETTATAAVPSETQPQLIPDNLRSQLSLSNMSSKSTPSINPNASPAKPLEVEKEKSNRRRSLPQNALSSLFQMAIITSSEDSEGTIRIQSKQSDSNLLTATDSGHSSSASLGHLRKIAQRVSQLNKFSSGAKKAAHRPDDINRKVDEMIVKIKAYYDHIEASLESKLEADILHTKLSSNLTATDAETPITQRIVFPFKVGSQDDISFVYFTDKSGHIKLRLAKYHYRYKRHSVIPFVTLSTQPMKKTFFQNCKKMRDDRDHVRTFKPRRHSFQSDCQLMQLQQQYSFI